MAADYSIERWHTSFRMRERYVKHANKLNKWSLMGDLPAETRQLDSAFKAPDCHHFFRGESLPAAAVDVQSSSKRLKHGH